MSESQKETFRKYLEQAGAIDVLVKGEASKAWPRGALNMLPESAPLAGAYTPTIVHDTTGLIAA